MLRIEFEYYDLSMGNEDWFYLLFDEVTAEFSIEHRWSHRKTGNPYAYEKGKKEYALVAFKQEYSNEFATLVSKFKSFGLK